MPSTRTRLFALQLTVVIATGCGGKVVFDEPGSGGATAGTTHAATTGLSSTGSSPSCLTAVTVGSGDFGPSKAFGTKCFTRTSGSCPSLYAANAYIEVDPCHALSSVDRACTAPKPEECCYDITEDLTCKAN